MDAQQALGPRTGGHVARRGVLAGVAAVIAGVLTKAGERVASATDGSALIVGQNNTSTGKTILTHTPDPFTFQAMEIDSSVTCMQAVTSTGSSDVLHIVHLGSGTGVIGTTQTGDALVGTSNSGRGVAGQTSASDATVAGVFGQSIAATSGGVRGDAGSGVGVRGNSGRSGAAPGIGVLGVADANSRALAAPGQSAGVYGLSSSSATGVVGQSNTGVGCQGSSNGNVGVLGTSASSVGVYANSLSQYGLYATSPTSYAAIGTSNSGTGVYGSSNGNVGVLGTSNSSIGVFGASSSGTGVYGTGPANGFAARFDGPVQVNGAFTVLGGPKSAAVPHPDGSYRRLYCVESPESWFEDFGQEQLANGRASVQLDRDFAALVHGGNYHVFLTPEGDTKGLYVSNKGAGAFEVREAQGGTGGLAFSYRVVAKRKDIAGPRLERVEVPAAAPRPAAPQAPTIPAVPALPDPSAPVRNAPDRPVGGAS